MKCLETRPSSDSLVEVVGPEREAGLSANKVGAVAASLPSHLLWIILHKPFRLQSFLGVLELVTLSHLLSFPYIYWYLLCVRHCRRGDDIIGKLAM